MAAFSPALRLYRRQEIILAGEKYEIYIEYGRESDGFAQEALCKKIGPTSNNLG
jgi:hypothetical protein